MKVEISKLEGHARFHAVRAMMTEWETMTLSACLRLSIGAWEGKIEGKTLCMWGLIPPSLMSDQAYLWLYTSPEMDAHKFVLVRYSQRVIEMLLEDFPIIRGQCKIENERAIRWVKWLGGTFGEPQGLMVPFVIRRKHG